jgi:hypothetical protein
MQTHKIAQRPQDVLSKDICTENVLQILPLKTSPRLLKKLNIDLPFDPAIPLLGIYPKD